MTHNTQHDAAMTAEHKAKRNQTATLEEYKDSLQSENQQPQNRTAEYQQCLYEKLRYMTHMHEAIERSLKEAVDAYRDKMSDLLKCMESTPNAQFQFDNVVKLAMHNTRLLDRHTEFFSTHLSPFVGEVERATMTGDRSELQKMFEKALKLQGYLEALGQKAANERSLPLSF